MAAKLLPLDDIEEIRRLEQQLVSELLGVTSVEGAGLWVQKVMTKMDERRDGYSIIDNVYRSDIPHDADGMPILGASASSPQLIVPPTMQESLEKLLTPNACGPVRRCNCTAHIERLPFCYRWCNSHIPSDGQGDCVKCEAKDVPIAFHYSCRRQLCNDCYVGCRCNE